MTNIDLLYGRSDENIARLVNALRPHAPCLRGAPPGRPKDLEVLAELELLRDMPPL